MAKTALVTGGHGFLGRAVARAFKAQGMRIVGLGRGDWGIAEARAAGFDAWVHGDVSRAHLQALDERYEVVVHCAGNSSVAYSLAEPLAAFEMTVQSTVELMEHLRLTESKAIVLYPSSAAVYGATEDTPLRESDKPNPVSPYGWHKKIVEDLLESYAQCFGIKAVAIRFFSIYGPGLAKQLLWDAARKLSTAEADVTFWGTGEETRDWLHVDDAAALFALCADIASPFTVVNGASGNRITVQTVLNMLKKTMGVTADIRFNGAIKPGDPRFYHADVSRAHLLGLRPTITLADGIQQYVQWFNKT